MKKKLSVVDVRPISPRLLGVVLPLGDARLVIIVAHAPHSGDTPNARDNFYDDADALISAYRRRYKSAMRLLLLGDFNGEVGSVNSPAVGQWAPATENDGGMRLRQFAEAHHLVIASTFNGNGDATSWVDAFGGGHRIDYVVCEEDLSRCCENPDGLVVALAAHHAAALSSSSSKDGTRKVYLIGSLQLPCQPFTT